MLLLPRFVLPNSPSLAPMNVLLLETIAFLGATVHTMDGPDPAVATVLVTDGIISAVGADLVVPDGARKVDLTGLHLVPGLIDTVVTFDAEHDVLYLDAGVTLVRDSGSPTGAMLMEKTPSMRDRHPGPSLFTTSPVFASQLATQPGSFTLGPILQAEEQVAEIMGLVDQAGMKLETLSFDDSVTLEQHALILETAKGKGIEAWGPVPRVLSLSRAAAAGQTMLLGLDSVLPQGERFETLPDAFDFPALALTLKDHWRAVPLLMGTARIVRGAAQSQEPAVVAALSPDYQVAWRSDLENFRILSRSSGMGLATKSVARQGLFAKSLWEAGVPLIAGSGAPSGGIAPGSGLVDELAEWARAGIPPSDALAAATVHAAKALGAEAERGRIAQGLMADMIAVGSDPRRSVEALRKPELVCLRGKVIERFELDEMVAALVARQKANQEARNAPIALTAPPMPAGDILLDGYANLVTYGSRDAVERYQVVDAGGGTMVYGARVRVLPTATSPARELVIVQHIKDNIVAQFDLTLDVVEANGAPRRDDNGNPAFSARGTQVVASSKLNIERRRFSEHLGNQRANETIGLVEGSSILSGVIAAKHFPEGASYAVEFEGSMMEPVVDRVMLAISAADGRISMNDSRGLRVMGFGAGGEFLFGARAEDDGRLDFVPVKPWSADVANQYVSLMELPEGRTFTGDPERWNDPKAAAEAAASKAGDGK